MKRNITKVLGMVLALGMAFLWNSCLKNNKYYVDFSKGKPSLELPLAAKYSNGPFAVSFDVADTPSTYYAVVNVASVNKLTTPVTCTLGIDSAFMNEYNADQLANDSEYVPFELLPDSTYIISSWDLEVPANEREAKMPIKIITSKMEQGHNYILPLTITKASIAISNWNHLMINVGSKNKYDGVYEVSGTMEDVTNAAFSGYYPKDVELVTQGISTDAYFDKALGNFGYVFDAGGGSLSYFGNWGPVFKFDDDNNVISASNYFNDPPPRSRSTKLDPNGENKYDPDTKTLKVSYFMMESGAVRLKITETFKYKGPR